MGILNALYRPYHVMRNRQGCVKENLDLHKLRALAIDHEQVELLQEKKIKIRMFSQHSSTNATFITFPSSISSQVSGKVEAGCCWAAAAANEAHV